jgi:hypothetical protein
MGAANDLAGVVETLRDIGGIHLVGDRPRRTGS